MQVFDTELAVVAAGSACVFKKSRCCLQALFLAGTLARPLKELLSDHRPLTPLDLLGLLSTGKLPSTGGAVCADAPDDTPALQCIGQSQQQTPRGPPLTGTDPSAQAPKPVPAQQQQSARSAELIDGCVLHIKGDAMDAVQSPVCQSVTARDVACMHVLIAGG